MGSGGREGDEFGKKSETRFQRAGKGRRWQLRSGKEEKRPAAASGTPAQSLGRRSGGLSGSFQQPFAS